MNSTPDTEEPVIEPKPNGDEGMEVTERALRLRIRQQEILTELGVLALKGTPFEELLGQTATLAAEGLQAEFCKVLEHLPAEHCLLVRAGLGWPPGIVGSARIGDDGASPAGFALRTGKPVISNHLEHEERFRTPDLLAANGIRRAMNVILQGDGRPFGVLEVDGARLARLTEKPTAHYLINAGIYVIEPTLLDEIPRGRFFPDRKSVV